MKSILTALMLLVLPFQVVAVPILDQSYNPSSIDAGSGVGSVNFVDKSQTFTAGISGTLTQVDLLNFQRDPATTMGLLFDIRTTSGGLPTNPDSGANILASLSIAASSVSTTAGTFSVDLSPFSVSVAIGDVLAIVLRSDGPDNFSYRWGATQTDGYAGGSAFTRVGDSSNGWTGGPTFVIQDNTFQTFVDTATVPEPSTLALLSLGFIGIGAARKLKKH